MTTNHRTHFTCVPYRHNFEIFSFVWIIGTSDWLLSLVGPTFKIIHDFIPHFPFLTAAPPVTCPKVSQVCECRWEHILLLSDLNPYLLQENPALLKVSLGGWDSSVLSWMLMTYAVF